jgi:hypothetical protein
MKLLPGGKRQKNLAIVGGIFFAMPAAISAMNAISLLATDDYVPEEVLLGTLLAAALMVSLAGWMFYYGLTDRNEGN